MRQAYYRLVAGRSQEPLAVLDLSLPAIADREASDPSDLVFGILGLVTDQGKTKIYSVLPPHSLTSLYMHSGQDHE